MDTLSWPVMSHCITKETQETIIEFKKMPRPTSRLKSRVSVLVVGLSHNKFGYFSFFFFPIN